MIKPPKLNRNPWFFLLLFCLGAFLLYWPILGRSFASDDFLVMKRVGMDKVIWIKGFFRPLSDITLYFNYWLGGFNPIGYYGLNILMHGINAFLLFRTCLFWKWTDDENKQRWYAILAALLFLCYPFHNEGIVWVLGRASLAANLFGILALLAVVCGLPKGWRIFWCCLCYFIGMAGYESVLLLPLMVWVILYGRATPRREYVLWGTALGATLLVHIVLRIAVSGSIAGEYGGRFFGNQLLKYGGNLFKLAGRLFLPPMENNRLMVSLFVLVMAGLAGVVVLFLRKKPRDPLVRAYFLKLLLLLAVACVVPFLSGVSSHTSESDRFLYFPSFFLCAVEALLLISLLTRRGVLVGAVVLLCYQCIFLERNNWNWVRASAITKDVLSTVGREVAVRKVFVVNLPDERDGAFIFRLGLPDALLMSGMDTSRLVIVSHLSRQEELSLTDSIGVYRTGGQVHIPPGVIIQRQGRDSFRITGSGDGQIQGIRQKEERYTWQGGRKDLVLYWNQKRLVEWDPIKEGL